MFPGEIKMTEKNHIKTVDELTFTDDGMFQAVMHDPEICAELIERLLHIRVKKIEYPELEKVIAPYYSSKGVRLDVYIKDSDRIIDIECQANLKPSLGKRTRYYQSMIDIDCLMKGESYHKLKESFILFLCKEDPFYDENNKRYGLPCYTFKNICAENSHINLNDKTMKVIYNASAYEKENDKLIKAFLRFIHTNEPGEDDFSNRLSRIVTKLKENEKFRSDYLAMNLHDFDIRYEALNEGRQEKAVEAAINAIALGLSPEQISKITSLTVEQILELQKEVMVKA